MPSSPFHWLRDEVFNLSSTQAVLRTDGLGRVLELQARPALEPAQLAEGIDVVLAAVNTLGRAGRFGELQTAVLSFSRGHVVVGAMGGSGALAVVAEEGANIGLLLGQMRRALAGEGAS
jgi:predicted regulator of Ras-like GTPase activity (Roadblock/LC7/MglB family)